MDWTHIEIKWNEMARRLQNISPPPTADNVAIAGENVTLLRPKDPNEDSTLHATDDVARVAV